MNSFSTSPPSLFDHTLEFRPVFGLKHTDACIGEISPRIDAFASRDDVRALGEATRISGFFSYFRDVLRRDHCTGSKPCFTKISRARGLVTKRMNCAASGLATLVSAIG